MSLLSEYTSGRSDILLTCLEDKKLTDIFSLQQENFESLLAEEAVALELMQGISDIEADIAYAIASDGKLKNDGQRRAAKSKLEADDLKLPSLKEALNSSKAKLKSLEFLNKQCAYALRLNE